MSESWIDPGSLEGDALTQWYLRSPAEVEQERQEAAARRYQEFFYGGAGNDPDPQFGHDVPAPSQDIDPGFTWVATGANRFRAVRTDGQPTDPSLPAGFHNAASSADGALRSNVSYRPAGGNPPVNSGLQPLSGTMAAPQSQHPPIDPSKTPVFQTGPDGKLHPVPGWHTTGPFDFGAWSHNTHWAGVAKDLGEIGTGVASFFSGVGLGGKLLSALGPEAETAVAEGIAESPAAKAADAIHGHHVNPKYMGGAVDGEQVDLVGRLHRAFHSMLGKAHREAGFPPVGGIGGSAKKWAEHYARNPGSHDEAMEILRRVSREFDQTYGTNISSKLPPSPPVAGGGLSPPD